MKPKKCKYCKKKIKDWDGPGYIDRYIEKIAICGNCLNENIEKARRR